MTTKMTQLLESIFYEPLSARSPIEDRGFTERLLRKAIREKLIDITVGDGWVLTDKGRQQLHDATRK